LTFSGSESCSTFAAELTESFSIGYKGLITSNICTLYTIEEDI